MQYRILTIPPAPKKAAIIPNRIKAIRKVHIIPYIVEKSFLVKHAYKVNPIVSPVVIKAAINTLSASYKVQMNATIHDSPKVNPNSMM